MPAFLSESSLLILTCYVLDDLCSRFAFHMCMGVRPDRASPVYLDRAIPEVDTNESHEVFRLFSTKSEPADCKYHSSKSGEIVK